MSYGDKLEDLLAFTQMGAISGPDALNSLYALQEERKAQRQARQAAALEAQQAQQDSLMGLASTAYESASAGDPLSLLIQNPEFAAASAELGMRPRQVAKQSGYYQGGVSTLNPQLDAEDLAAVEQTVYETISRVTRDSPIPPPAIKVRESVFNQLGITDADTHLIPALDSAITEAYGRAVRGL